MWALLITLEDLIVFTTFTLLWRFKGDHLLNTEVQVISLSSHLILVTTLSVILSLFYRWENTDPKGESNLPKTLPVCDAFGMDQWDETLLKAQWEVFPHWQPLLLCPNSHVRLPEAAAETTLQACGMSESALFCREARITMLHIPVYFGHWPPFFFHYLPRTQLLDCSLHSLEALPRCSPRLPLHYQQILCSISL